MLCSHDQPSSYAAHTNLGYQCQVGLKRGEGSEGENHGWMDVYRSGIRMDCWVRLNRD